MSEISPEVSEVDPGKLKLVLHPHPALRRQSRDVPINENGFVEPDLVRAVAERMKKVMRSMGERAIGLAANQVGLDWKMFICLDDLNSEARSENISVYINPKILSFFGVEVAEEGCLSFPGIKGMVSRPSAIHVQHYDLDGIEHSMLLSGLQARCYLHELDHLLGVNIIDKFNDADKRLNRAAIDRLASK